MAGGMVVCLEGGGAVLGAGGVHGGGDMDRGLEGGRPFIVEITRRTW